MHRDCLEPSSQRDTKYRGATRIQKLERVLNYLLQLRESPRDKGNLRTDSPLVELSLWRDCGVCMSRPCPLVKRRRGRGARDESTGCSVLPYVGSRIKIQFICISCLNKKEKKNGNTHFLLFSSFFINIPLLFTLICCFLF